MEHETKYDPFVVGFYFDIISTSNLFYVKKEVIESVLKMESDDRQYLWHPDYSNIFYSQGETVGRIENWSFPQIDNFRFALKESIYLIGEHNSNAKKQFFYITDCVSESKKHDIKQFILFEEKMNLNVNIHFCGLDKYYQKQVLECVSDYGHSYKHIDVNQEHCLSEYMMDCRKETTNGKKS